MTTTNEIFTYSWNIDEDEKETTCIRVYGLDKNNNNICLRINNFYPWVYIELPDNICWNHVKAQNVVNKINELLRDKKPLLSILEYKNKLYGAYLDENGNTKKYLYIKLHFSSVNDIKILGYALRKKQNIIGIGNNIQLKMHESDADPILQLVCSRNLKTSGWIKFCGKEVLNNDKISLCDKEYIVKYKNICNSEIKMVINPLILSFDIEVNSTNPSAMPNALKYGDKIFQISCILSRELDTEIDQYLFSLGEPDEEIVGKDVKIYMCESESDILIKFSEFICEKNPNIITGYNILGFDIPYMIQRAEMHLCITEFKRQGFIKNMASKKRTIKWTSAAFKNQEFEYIDAEGRLYVDLLPLVKRDYKFNNYKLKTISEYFLGESKDPLTPKGIFKCYRIGIKKNADETYSKKAKKAMGIVGKYCMVDSILVLNLMKKLKIWVGLTEMATVCNVKIFSLYTQGQQIKVFSQIYKYCMDKNIVVEKDGYQCSENERYMGAKVFPPIPGIYNMVVPFDFASLYPTTIIAYNIDYHTWVKDDSDIPDVLCNVFEWQEHIACCHDPKVIRKIELTKFIDTEKEKIKKLREKRDKILCKLRKKEIIEDINNKLKDLKPYTDERSDITKTIQKQVSCINRRYRFLKEPKGVLPTIIQNLLDARNNTRKEMKKLLKEIDTIDDNINLKFEKKTLYDVLDKRQLAFKISANSMYGAMGVRKGYLPFMPGAMCTTYMGRTNIEIVADVITNKYDGKLIYGDTDSNYICFPNIKTAQETWDNAIFVADEITKLFPKPIVLEFEEEIYAFFFILSKKRYMYRKCYRDGKIDMKIGKKGVLLARRDNSKFIRDLYENVINKIADSIKRDDILYYILQQINELCSGVKHYNDFVVTKSVGDSGNLIPHIFINEKGVKKIKIGDYTIPYLSEDKNEREEQFNKKNVNNEKDFYLSCLPAQVQLAERMKKRGNRVDSGSRLEYIVCDPENHNGKQYDKIESIDYMIKHREIIKIDYMYYLKALINPLDQVLDVAFGKDIDYQKGFIDNQYKYYIKIKNKLLKELNNITKPNLLFTN